jgi:hypothetical protein
MLAFADTGTGSLAPSSHSNHLTTQGAGAPLVDLPKISASQISQTPSDDTLATSSVDAFQSKSTGVWNVLSQTSWIHNTTDDFIPGALHLTIGLRDPRSWDLSTLDRDFASAQLDLGDKAVRPQGR